MQGISEKWTAPIPKRKRALIQIALLLTDPVPCHNQNISYTVSLTGQVPGGPESGALDPSVARLFAPLRQRDGNGVSSNDQHLLNDTR
jgi:hypothetical protein